MHIIHKINSIFYSKYLQTEQVIKYLFLQSYIHDNFYLNFGLIRYKRFSVQQICSFENGDDTFTLLYQQYYFIAGNFTV